MLPSPDHRFQLPFLPTLSGYAHGVLDYCAVVWLAVTPRLLGFGDASTATSLSVSLVILLLAVTTNYPLGLLKTVPLGFHLVMDFLLGTLLILSPSLLGLSPQDPGGPMLLGAGIVLLTATVLTQATVLLTARRRPSMLIPV